jgi:hypothetical protein
MKGGDRMKDAAAFAVFLLGWYMLLVVLSYQG